MASVYVGNIIIKTNRTDQSVPMIKLTGDNSLLINGNKLKILHMKDNGEAVLNFKVIQNIYRETSPGTWTLESFAADGHIADVEITSDPNNIQMRDTVFKMT